MPVSQNRPFTRIDPTLPLCWEDPQTLRLGFDQPEARVRAPTARMQRLIDALRDGVPQHQIAATLREAGASREDWTRLVETLAPALETPSAPAWGVAESETVSASHPMRIGVLGDGPSAQEMLRALQHAGFRASPFVPHHRDWQLVVVMERFIEIPILAEYRLASGLPQLLIRFSDRSFSVGPIVDGRGNPCLGCVTLHDVDADPALPALGAQLIGERPAAESEEATIAAAGLALTLIRHWQRGSVTTSRSRWRVTVTGGLPSPTASRERIAAHPDCGCGLNAAA